jgi:prevent-host-death family protein
MKSVSVADAKARLSELIDQLADGEELVITRHGQPIARLVLPARSRSHTHSISEAVPLSKDTVPADLDLLDSTSLQRR